MRGISIGAIAERTGLSVATIRFYEERGLVHPERNAGGHRAFGRGDIRRLSFVMIAQELGFSLKDIRAALESLPKRRTPTKADWEKLSRAFGAELDARIMRMQSLRHRLDGCIGCGCLSLEACHLYNKDDRAARRGQGPRYLRGDAPAMDAQNRD
ncbi:redox-sensitive transcriptional activator SoxR [Primorskyibacter sp. S187A]|uniref:redox-sensitive transcriptional activator SoxR n=1 Tax=Primorskyibacter sp. S187A TaxID=3415130 RepID=UPI003C7B5CA1